MACCALTEEPRLRRGKHAEASFGEEKAAALRLLRTSKLPHSQSGLRPRDVPYVGAVRPSYDPTGRHCRLRTEAVGGDHVGAVSEFAGGNALAAFELREFDVKGRVAAARNR